MSSHDISGPEAAAAAHPAPELEQEDQRPTKRAKQPVRLADGDADNAFLCPLCLEVFSNVVFLNGCGHEFCDPCIRHSLSVKKECPICRFHPVGEIPEVLTPNRRLQQEILALEVYCSYPGCNTVMKIQERDEHLKHCEYTPVKCEFFKYGCPYEDVRSTHAEHLINCPYEKLKEFFPKFVSLIDNITAKVKSLEALLSQKDEQLRAVSRNCKQHTSQHNLVIKILQREMASIQRHLRHHADAQETDKIDFTVQRGDEAATRISFRMSMSQKMGKLMTKYCEKVNLPENSLAFYCDSWRNGHRIDPSDTCFLLGLRNYDTIYVMPVAAPNFAPDFLQQRFQPAAPFDVLTASTPTLPNTRTVPVLSLHTNSNTDTASTTTTTTAAPGDATNVSAAVTPLPLAASSVVDVETSTPAPYAPLDGL